MPGPRCAFIPGPVGEELYISSETERGCTISIERARGRFGEDGGFSTDTCHLTVFFVPEDSPARNTRHLARS